MLEVLEKESKSKRSNLIGKALKVNYKGKIYEGTINTYIPNTMGKSLFTLFVPNLEKELLLSLKGNKFIVLGLYNPFY